MDDRLSNAKQRLRAVRDKITTEVFDLWLQRAASDPEEEKGHPEEVEAHLGTILPTLVRVGGRTANDAPVLIRLEGLLRSKPLIALKAVGKIGPAAATTEILKSLAEGLRDPDRYVRRRAAEAVWAIGPAAATTDFLKSLAEGLRDPEWQVRQRATEAVWAIGSAAIQNPNHGPSILERLVRLQENGDIQAPTVLWNLCHSREDSLRLFTADNARAVPVTHLASLA